MQFICTYVYVFVHIYILVCAIQFKCIWQHNKSYETNDYIYLFYFFFCFFLSSFFFHIFDYFSILGFFDFSAIFWSARQAEHDWRTWSLRSWCDADANNSKTHIKMHKFVTTTKNDKKISNIHKSNKKRKQKSQPHSNDNSDERMSSLERKVTGEWKEGLFGMQSGNVFLGSS